jgi:hypothetical protein
MINYRGYFLSPLSPMGERVRVRGKKLVLPLVNILY